MEPLEQRKWDEMSRAEAEGAAWIPVRRGDVGKHSEEAAEQRGIWFRWHDGSNVGWPPGFYHGGKFAQDRPVTQ